MNRHVNAISGRLSLRPPQRESLAILDRICEILPPKKGSDSPNGDAMRDRTTGLAAIQSEFPTLTDFEREFPSLCFSLATGVGKTRLMGAFITYLYLAHGIRNFFVLAPNLTIYNKLISDFTPNTPKYVFKGISEFAIDTPEIITGDNYEKSATTLKGLYDCKINIFNISKINTEVRGGKSPKIKRLSEYIGESYFDYLANLPDLVILMDESHRYRASAGIRAINELKPVLGLEFTATPLIETSKERIYFKNVVFDYPLGRAMADEFVKEPAVVTRKDFNPAGMSPEEIERIKLEDGIRLHESLKVDLETYARNASVKIVKPFIDRLLKVESPDEPTEIVIHVNMLKEGWDVTNLYTIIPLRAANARILIEQTIGRGLRLPYGKRTGITAVDRLNIIAHDKFQEIVDESKRPDSQIRMQQLILTPESLQAKPKTVVSQSRLDDQLGLGSASSNPTTSNPTPNYFSPGINAAVPKPAFKTAQEQDIAKIAYQAIRNLERQPKTAPTTAYLASAKIQAYVKEVVIQAYNPAQLELEGVIEQPDIAAIIAKTTELVIQQTIDIPRILVVPLGEVQSGFHPFTLELSNLNYPVPSTDLWIQHLRTQETEVLGLDRSTNREVRPEDYIVSGLISFDDICYDEQADLLYNLADQVVKHLQTYLSKDDLEKVLQLYQRPISKLIHAQMQPHFWEEAIVGYEVQVRRGFTELKPSAYTISGAGTLDFKQSPSDKSKMSQYLFSGFSRCLYTIQKFDSEAERVLSVILDRDSLKWFKPAKGQFQIFYRWNGEHPEYQPDFVAETNDMIYMLEPKARNQIDAADVIAKKNAAIQWCQNASEHTTANNGKPWAYILIPHDEIKENMTLKGLYDRFLVQRYDE